MWLLCIFRQQKQLCKLQHMLIKACTHIPTIVYISTGFVCLWHHYHWVQLGLLKLKLLKLNQRVKCMLLPYLHFAIIYTTRMQYVLEEKA